MSSKETSDFLKVALNVQAPPYSGIRCTGGLMAATDGTMFVAWNASEDFVSGEGMLAPQAAQVLAALADATYLRHISVEGNRVAVEAQGTRFEKNVGVVYGEYAPVTLPEFYCYPSLVEKLYAKLNSPSLAWAKIAEAPSLRAVKDAGAKAMLALVDAPRTGGELFRLKEDGDDLWYSADQLRRGLRLFRAKARLVVSRSRDGWLKFEDGFGRVFAVTPFRRLD